MSDHTDCMVGLAATLETYTDEQRARAEKAEAELAENVAVSSRPSASTRHRRG